MNMTWTIPMTEAEKRLEKIAEIIERVDNRCAAVDGPVTPTREEITGRELIEIYKLAKGR